jgi:hypothetical protein
MSKYDPYAPQDGYVVMTVKKITIQGLETFGKTQGLKLAVDPFHGSTAYEFQKCGEKVVCAGCIIGPVTTTLYTRILRGRMSINYQAIKSISSAKLEIDIITEFVAEHLLSNRLADAERPKTC